MAMEAGQPLQLQENLCDVLTPSAMTGTTLEPGEWQRMLDRQEIQELKAKYCRFVDTKQWAALRTLFCPDARFEGLGSAPNGADLDTFIDGISTRLQPTVSIHHCHMPEIQFQNNESARGVWAMMDYVQWPKGFAPKEAPARAGFFGYGHYEEEYRRVQGRWKIAFLRLTRLRIDPLPEDFPEPRGGLLSASPAWLIQR
jgi:hypothetical protein